MLGKEKRREESKNKSEQRSPTGCHGRHRGPDVATYIDSLQGHNVLLEKGKLIS